jgi:type IV secretory pathway VirB4 component
MFQAPTYGDLIKTFRRKEQKLASVLQYVDFMPYNIVGDLPVIVQKDGSYLVLFECEGIDYEGNSVKDQELASHYVAKAFEKLEPGFVAESLVIRKKATIPKIAVLEGAPRIATYLKERKEQFWSKEAENTYSSRLILTFKMKPKGANKKKPYTFYISDKNRYAYLEKEMREWFKDFQSNYISFSSSMERFGAKVMNREQAFEALYSLINQKPAPRYNPDLSLNAQLADSYYLFKGNVLQFDDGRRFMKSITVKGYPQGTIALYLRKLYEIGCELTLRVSGEILDYKKLQSKLGMRSNIANSLRRYNAAAGMYVDEVAGFVGEVEGNNRVPISMDFYVYVYGTNEEDLNLSLAKIDTTMKEIGFGPQEERGNFKNAAFTLLPGHHQFSGRKTTVLSSNMGDLFPVHRLYPGDDKPTEFYLDKSDAVFSFDPFTPRETAHHMMISGPSGMGKSFVAQKMVTASLGIKPLIYVVDLSQSFTSMFEVLQDEMPEKTSIMRITSEKLDFRFNPFLVEPDMDFESPEFETQIEFCESLVKIMMGKAVDETNRVKIRKSLANFFLEYRMMLKTAPKAPPPLGMLHSIIKQETRDERMANALESWLYGRKGELFNSGQDDFTSAEYCYFDLQDIEKSHEEMQAIIFSLFGKIQTDIQKNHDRGKKKFLMLDEAHRYLQIPEFRHWITQFCRMGRHYNVQVGIITQSIKDLFGNDENSGITTNLKQLIMYGGEMNIDETFQKMAFSEHAIDAYHQLEVSKREFLFWRSSGVVRRLHALTDPWSYWLHTSAPRDRVLRDKYKKKHKGDLLAAIEEIVSISETMKTAESRYRALEEGVSA